MGISFEDEVRALLLLGSLPNTWKTLKVTLCNSAPNGIVTWKLVKTKVINEETRRLAERDSSSSKSKVLVIESWGRSKSRGLKKGRAKSRSKSRGRNAEVCRHEISSRAEGTRASRKGPLDGAGDPPSFSVGMVIMCTPPETCQSI